MSNFGFYLLQRASSLRGYGAHRLRFALIISYGDPVVSRSHFSILSGNISIAENPELFHKGRNTS
ncbi:hypothetical protein DLM76_10775 [Leptospira yasudae]|nr:hypothetical protein DLM76_10775 [Leptospira yasudae]